MGNFYPNLLISQDSYIYVTIFVVFEFSSYCGNTYLSATINVLLFSVLPFLVRSSAYCSCNIESKYNRFHFKLS